MIYNETTDYWKEKSKNILKEKLRFKLKRIELPKRELEFQSSQQSIQESSEIERTANEKTEEPTHALSAEK